MLVLTSLIFYLYRRSYVQFSPLLNDLPTFNTTNFHSPSILRYETILYISDICIINEIMDPESGRFLTFVSSVGLKDQNRGQGNGSSPSLLPIPFPGRVWAFICTQTLVNRGRKVLARYKLGGSPPPPLVDPSLPLIRYGFIFKQVGSIYRRESDSSKGNLRDVVSMGKCSIGLSDDLSALDLFPTPSLYFNAVAFLPLLNCLVPPSGYFITVII